jgi:hypothetical protein
MWVLSEQSFENSTCILLFIYLLFINDTFSSSDCVAYGDKENVKVKLSLCLIKQ